MKKTLLISVLVLLCTACGDKLTPPAFISVGSMQLVPLAEDAVTADPGYYTSNIVAAHVVAYRKGASKVDTIGVFRLPFTVPVFAEGEFEYIDFYPAIPQSGKLNMLPFYTYYNRASVKNVTLTQGDTLRLDTLSVTYNPKTDFPLCYLSFEPVDPEIHMKGVEWITGDAQGACTGSGYVKVEVPADTDHYDFELDMQNDFDGGLDFYVEDETKLLYLEFDIKATSEMAVRMTSRRLQTGNAITKEVMRVNPTGGEWIHIYCNLGRVWPYFNYYPYFSLSFSALNVEGGSGTVCLDNVKLITTNVVL